MSARRRILAFVVAGLAVSAFTAFLISPYASSQPDGLERVAMDNGFADTAIDHVAAAGPLADYTVSGVDDQRLSTGAAGLFGVAICFAVGLAATWVVLRRAVGQHPQDVANVPDGMNDANETNGAA